VIELCQRALLPADMEDVNGLNRLLWQTAGVVGFVAERDDAVVGAAFGTVTNESDGTTSGAITLIAVEPGQSRRGVGSALLENLELRLRELGAGEIWAGGGQPRFWWPGIDENCPAVLGFFEKAGYARRGTAPNMRVVLAESDLGHRATGETDISRLKAEEWPAFRQWMDDTWKSPWGAEVQATLDRSPISCFVAVHDGRYIGFAAYDTNHRGWFGPMGCSPEARGSGLGSELLRHCLRDYADRGEVECQIGWVGPADFYTKTIGASISRTFLRLSK
jgi:ribosomal protein S18 acetylase RimI-like enzyme